MYFIKGLAIYYNGIKLMFLFLFVSAVNSDLSLKIEANGTKASPLTFDGFAFVWSGARATYGVNKGKVCFEVKVMEIFLSIYCC